MMRKMLCLLSALVFLSVFSSAACADGITVTEESGGEFRPLPISLEGGSSLPFTFQYNQKYDFYEDPTIRVDRYWVDRSQSAFNAAYWYSVVTIRDASQLRTASASENNPFLDGTVNKGFVIARRKKAVLAINGDYCAAFSSEKPTNYILRQGVVYRDSVMDKLDILLIDEDGDFHVLSPDAVDLAAADKTMIDGKKVINAFQFGPALVVDGEAVPDEIILDYERSPHFSNPDRRAQRMVVCQVGPLQYMVLCCAFYGLSLTEMRDLALSLAPVQTVYTLDGGESSQMVFLGHWYNSGANGNTEARGITDIIYFASAWFKD